MSQDAAPTTLNAFAALMSQSSKKAPTLDSIRKRRKSLLSFVACPAGCGNHFRPGDMNAHLDGCIGKARTNASSSATPSLPSSIAPDMVRYCRNNESDVVVSPEGVSSLPSPVRLQLPLGRLVFKKRRVMCPICETSFPKSIINLHLDQCVGRKPDPHIQGTMSCKKEPPIAAVPDKKEVDHHVRAHDTSSDLVEDRCLPVIHCVPSNLVSMKGADATAEVSVAIPSPPPHMNPVTSVFTKMMSRSKALADQEKEDTVVTVLQSFHLDERMRLALHWSRNSEQEWVHPTWSAIVSLKDRPQQPFNGVKDARATLNIDVSVSTSIPYGLNEIPTRWVRQHSRLSVPVLKSILQKSIRRRRPLPSVRVAMELADKSLGDLLRRLPVIVLEDSTLHPDTDFLVWLMMAHSKEFVPTKRLMVRLFQIVFEIASCPWYDWKSETVDKNVDHETSTTLSSLIQQYQIEAMSSSTFPGSLASSSVLWSLLVRAKYGGMRCDIVMLHSAAAIWRCRCASPVPEAVAKCISRSNIKDVTLSITWSDVPRLLHQRGKELGMDRVSTLCQDGIDRLTMEDICVEGVDFHCSGIIDELLADDQLSGICFDLLVIADDDVFREVSVAKENRTLLLQGLFKKYMWNLSSGINYRRRLLSGQTASSENKHTDAGMWHELIGPRALAYQVHYVRQRLA